MTVAGSLDCGSCRQPFDLGPRRPKVLPCGHTCCRGCLLEREGSDRYVRCLEDNKVFAGMIDELMDNMRLISAIDHSSSSCTASKRSLLEALERSALNLKEELTALSALRSQVLAALRSSVNDVLEKQLPVLQCLARLRLATRTEEAWELQRQAAHRLLETEEPQRQELRQDLRLVRGRRLAARAALELRRAGSLSAAAEAELQLEEQPALRLAAALLRQQGDLPHVQYKEKEVQLGHYYMKSMSDVPADCERWKKDKALLLETSTKFKEWNSRLYCTADPAWSLALMRRHSVTLTYVRLDRARLEHVAALWEFPLLQELEITLHDDKAELAVDYAGRPLQWPPPRPSEAQRLWCLIHLDVPWSVARALFLAHRHSLVEVVTLRARRWGAASWPEVSAVLREMTSLRRVNLTSPALVKEDAAVVRSALPAGCELAYEEEEEKLSKTEGSKWCRLQ